MAKSSRASTRKANNRRLKANVFGPVESARAERLSAKLLELASQPKPEAKEIRIVEDVETAEAEEAGAKMDEDAAAENADDTAMDVDSNNNNSMAAKSPSSNNKRNGKGRIQKRKKKANKVVFTLYKDRKSSKRKH
ncbi:hypothetical protein DL766_003224 [Monosporascus sp. MC13-8B]|uniref:DUF2423 domain-containing protein n=1 Tax=Monosporascus cannonballus TaxID=155416 RepID=A0ABY0H2J6_9PEZI|nr:hypothetical protein DL762_007720 [Monosporascus cannonballus]RYO92511.1 hypothetical protein DL763_004640 [Monosporascus cannonballus]RYP33952.1 hypothetical protein DL766_003224 [Monosporascus sp. MC13-8B]